MTNATEVPAVLGPVERIVRPGSEARPLVERLRRRAHNGIEPMHELARLDMLEASAEIERLSAALAKANDLAERFEREWYLRGDEIERLREHAVILAETARQVEQERCARIVERINGWTGTREVAAEIRGETQILRA